jgi:hypothetical protein
VDGARDVALVPGLGGTGVEDDEAGVAVGGEGGGDVGHVGVEDEARTEVGGGLGRSRGGDAQDGVDDGSAGAHALAFP